MAKLVIKRGPEFMNRLRDFNLELDGRLLGSITHNEVREFDIPAGRHNLKSSIDWCSSPEITFEIQENETRFAEINSFKGSTWLLKLDLFLLPVFFALVFFPQFFNLNPVYSFITAALFLPPFLFLVYKLTLDRKNYLQLHIQ